MQLLTQYLMLLTGFVADMFFHERFSLSSCYSAVCTGLKQVSPPHPAILIKRCMRFRNSKETSKLEANGVEINPLLKFPTR